VKGRKITERETKFYLSSLQVINKNQPYIPTNNKQNKNWYTSRSGLVSTLGAKPYAGGRPSKSIISPPNIYSASHAIYVLISKK